MTIIVYVIFNIINKPTTMKPTEQSEKNKMYKMYKREMKMAAIKKEMDMARKICQEVPAMSNEQIKVYARAYRHNHDLLAVINYEMFIRSFC